jgi:hypothetical protein
MHILGSNFFNCSSVKDLKLKFNVIRIVLAISIIIYYKYTLNYNNKTYNTYHILNVIKKGKPNLLDSPLINNKIERPTYLILP